LSKTLRTWALLVFNTFDDRKTLIFSLRCGLHPELKRSGSV
jgi:hypothetical protein